MVGEARNWKRTFVAAMLAVVVVATGVVAFETTASAAPTGAGCTGPESAERSDEREFLTLLNGVRRLFGKPAVVENAALSERAREWSDYMADRNKLMHANTANGTPSHLLYVEQIKRLVPNWRRAGENVGRGPTVRSLHDAFVASSGHFANMIGDFNQVGIGVVVRNGTIWVTVRFAKGDLPPPVPPPASLDAFSGFQEAPGYWCVGDLPLVGDFDGNGRDDILYYGRGATGDGLVLNRLQGSVRRSVSISGHYEPFVADFDGDGRDDIMWYAPGHAADFLWYGRSDGTFRSVSLSIRGDYEPLVGDFDGNGRTDIFWYAAGWRPDYYWYSTSSGFRSVRRDANGTYDPMVGDFDGNGRDDIFWYAPGGRADYLWYNTASGVTSKRWTVNGRYRTVLADLDGDGNKDIFWYAPGSHPDYVWFLEGRQITSRRRDVHGTYEVHVGDFDGNNVEDLLFFTPSAATDSVWLFGRQRMSIDVRSGKVTGGFRPGIGDFNGDGKDDITWRLPGGGADRTWFGG